MSARIRRMDRIDAELAKLLSHAEEQRALCAINPNANCGANDPKTPHSSVDISYEVNVSFVPIAIRGGNSVDSARATALDWMDKKGDTAEIVRVTREVVEVLDGCGHA